MGSSVPLSREHGGDAVRRGAVGSEPGASVGELFLIANLIWPESALFAALVADQLQMTQYLLLHIGACATIAAFGLCRIWWLGVAEQGASRTAVLLHGITWIVLGGPFGALISAGLLLRPTASVGHRRNLSDQVPEETELTRVEALHSKLLDRRFRLQQAHHVPSMLDVMIDGTRVEKLDALRLIANRYVPGLATATWRALEDKDAAVRVFAATVMAHQHNTHTKRIGSLQTAATNEPGCPDSWRKLAHAHFDYAACGLLDTSRAEQETREARACMARATQFALAVEQH